MYFIYIFYSALSSEIEIHASDAWYHEMDQGVAAVAFLCGARTMHLTLYTDYSLRLLLYLALHPEGATISDVAEVYGISRNHLVRIANDLGKRGVIQTLRGRSGGLRLLARPEEINVGEIVREIEPFNVVECFDPAQNTCRISPVCKLKHVLFEAQQSFLGVLDGYTLADLIENQEELLEQLGPVPAK